MIPHSKKGSVELSLEQTIGLILAIGFILLSIAVIVGLMKAFTSPPDQGTTKMYSRMYDASLAMLNPANLNDSCKISRGYIDTDYAIVGFNPEGTPNKKGEIGTKGTEDYGLVRETCGWFSDKPVYKPTSCFNKACLCLCRTGTGSLGKDGCKDKQSRCMRLDAAQRLITYFKNSDKDLVLYGKSCILGSKHNVIAGYVIKKKGDSLSINEVLTNEEMKQYNYPECDDIAKSFSRGSAPVAQKVEAPKEAPKSSFCEDSKNAGGGCSGTQIKVST